MTIDALVNSSVEQATSQRSRLLFRDERRRWTTDELKYLRVNLGLKPIAEIAVALGRSAAAVKIKWTRKGYSPKHKDFYTRTDVAAMLGVDIHAVMVWEKLGLLPFERAPGYKVGRGNDRRRVHSSKLRRWVVKPDNFIYFLYTEGKQFRFIPHSGYRSLIEAAFMAWGDDWWSAGMVERYYGVSHGCIHQRVRRGKLKAVKWGNWWIKRSDAMATPIYPGKGSAKRRR